MARTASSSSSITTPRSASTSVRPCLSWLEAKAPDVYDAILDSRPGKPKKIFRPRLRYGPGLQSRDHAAGQQPRSASLRLLWGIRDFRTTLQARAGRNVAAGNRRGSGNSGDCSPSLACVSPFWRRTRRRACAASARRDWHEVKRLAHRSDTRAYQHRLPSGRSIALFFYDGPIARAVAFEGLLSHGDVSSNRLTGAFADERDGRNSSISPPTAKATAITIASATWPWPTSWNRSRPIAPAQLDELRRISRHNIRRPTKSKSSRKAPGAAPTASIAGGAIAAATPAAHPGWNQAVAHAAAQRAGLAARHHRAALGRQGAGAIQRSLGRPRRLHRRHPRSIGGKRSKVFHRSRRREA